MRKPKIIIRVKYLNDEDDTLEEIRFSTNSFKMEPKIYTAEDHCSAFKILEYTAEYVKAIDKRYRVDLNVTDFNLIIRMV